MSSMLRTMARKGGWWKRSAKRGARLRTASNFMARHSIPFFQFIARAAKKAVSRKWKRICRKRALAAGKLGVTA